MLSDKPPLHDPRRTPSTPSLLASLLRLLATALALGFCVLVRLLLPLLHHLPRRLVSLDRLRFGESDESYVSAVEDHPRPWPRMGQDAPAPSQVHHHHIYYPPSRTLRQISLLSRVPGSARVSELLGAANASEYALDTDSDSDQGTVGPEGPLQGLALELHRMAMQAQAEFDARLPRSAARRVPRTMIDASGAIKEEDHDRHPDSSDDSPVLAAITSKDPSTPLQFRPITVYLGPGGKAPAPPPSAFPPSFSPPGSQRPPHPIMGQRRASAPDPILLSPLRAAETGPRQTSDSFRMFRRASASSQGSSAGKKIRLTEPDWQPYAESHARARTRVQLNALLSSARDMHSRERTRHTSLKSSSEEPLAPGPLAGSRWDLKWHTLSAHTMQSGTHATVPARFHRNALPLSFSGVGSLTQGPGGSPTPSGFGRTLSSAPDGTASPVPPEEPDLWFERFFPGRAAAGPEWDWRRPTPQRILHERRAAQEAARRAGAAYRPRWSRVEREEPCGGEMDEQEPVLGQVAQLLFDPPDSPPTRTPLARIVSHANAAATSVASSAQLSRKTLVRRTRAGSSPSPATRAEMDVPDTSRTASYSRLSRSQGHGKKEKEQLLTICT